MKIIIITYSLYKVSVDFNFKIADDKGLEKYEILSLVFTHVPLVTKTKVKTRLLS